MATNASDSLFIAHLMNRAEPLEDVNLSGFCQLLTLIYLLQTGLLSRVMRDDIRFHHAVADFL